MGYRSDWRIVFNTRHKAQHVEQTLKDYVALSPDTETKSLLVEMLNVVVSRTENTLVMEDSGWKLWGWDELLNTFENMFGDDPEIDIASIRLGEDPADNDIRYGDYTHIYICRAIDDTYLDDVPASPGDHGACVIAPPDSTLCACPLDQLMRGDGHNTGCGEQ